jgi:hypothetical protein
MRNAIVLVVVCTFTAACEEAKKPAEENAPAAAAVITSAAVKAEPAASAAAKAAEKAAEQEAQKAVEENPLTPCCRALDSRGMMQRSPEYKAASQDCGQAMGENMTLAQATTAIKAALKGKELPAECVAK